MVGTLQHKSKFAFLYQIGRLGVIIKFQIFGRWRGWGLGLGEGTTAFGNESVIAEEIVFKKVVYLKGCH